MAKINRLIYVKRWNSQHITLCFMVPLILATGNQFTLINPANGGKVCSDKDWDAAHKRSESTNLLTFEDMAIMSLSSCYWESIISSSTTFNENESIFKDDFSRIGCLFFNKKTNKDECEGLRMYYETFEKSFESVMEIQKQMCSQALTNCGLCILSLNIKSQVNTTKKVMKQHSTPMKTSSGSRLMGASGKWW